MGVSIIFIYVQNEHLKRKRKASFFFTQNRVSKQTVFYIQEELPNIVIGLNGLQRKLLIVEENNGRYDWNIIDLEEVKIVQ
jgi:hypothetical protein